MHNYDPHNYDDMYADEYGGYGTGMGGGFRNQSGNANSANNGNGPQRFGGGGGDNNRRGPPNDRFNGSGDDRRSNQGGGNRGNFDRRGGLFEDF